MNGSLDDQIGVDTSVDQIDPDLKDGWYFLRQYRADGWRVVNVIDGGAFGLCIEGSIPVYLLRGEWSFKYEADSLAVIDARKSPGGWVKSREIARSLDDTIPQNSLE